MYSSKAQAFMSPRVQSGLFKCPLIDREKGGGRLKDPFGELGKAQKRLLPVCPSVGRLPRVESFSNISSPRPQIRTREFRFETVKSDKDVLRKIKIGRGFSLKPITPKSKKGKRSCSTKIREIAKGKSFEHLEMSFGKS